MPPIPELTRTPSLGSRVSAIGLLSNAPPTTSHEDDEAPSGPPLIFRQQSWTRAVPEEDRYLMVRCDGVSKYLSAAAD